MCLGRLKGGDRRSSQVLRDTNAQTQCRVRVRRIEHNCRSSHTGGNQMIRNRTWSLMLLCLVFTMILAACGGAPAATPSTAPAAPAAEPTKSLADLPTRVS